MAGALQFNFNSERQIFEKLFRGSFITLRVFARSSSLTEINISLAVFRLPYSALKYKKYGKGVLKVECYCRFWCYSSYWAYLIGQLSKTNTLQDAHPTLAFLCAMAKTLLSTDATFSWQFYYSQSFCEQQFPNGDQYLVSTCMIALLCVKIQKIRESSVKSWKLLPVLML